MIKWVTSHLGAILLAGLSTIVVGPLCLTWWASREFTWATTLPILSIGALWLEFLYQHNATIRRLINDVLAEIGRKDAHLSAEVRYSVGDDINYGEIERAVRSFYVEPADAAAIRSLQGDGKMDIDVSGWRMRLDLSNLDGDEFGFGETAPRRDLLIEVPEIDNSVPGMKRILSRRMLPLFNHIEKRLGIQVQAAQVTIRFDKGINPYLSVYFQNVETSSIVSLKCVIAANEAMGRVTLAEDAVTLNAPDLLTLSGLADEHLVMRSRRA